MILKRFFDNKLAQTSYLIGCAATGEALVVDANRDADQYIAAAEADAVRITHITETHIHADYVSGTRELAARTGAKMYLSDEGGADWKYAFASAENAVLLKDGAEFRVGNIVIEAVHTPGHTPEHLSFLVTDTAAADKPIAILTGDFVFVGDVGRPDLLERAAKIAGTMEAGARVLFASLQKFKRYEDYLQVLPGHGAGSACGKGISSVPGSTVGYEKMFNWALAIDDEDEFVEAVLAGQPEPPVYFAEMKRINRDGPPVLGKLPAPRQLGADRLTSVLAEGAPVIDTRPADEFARGHVPGTINIPLNRSFNTWAGWLTPYHRDFYLIVPESCDRCAEEAAKDLAMIGLDSVAGWFSADALDTWTIGGGSLETIPQIAADELLVRMNRGDVAVLDVRGRTEWEAGHIPGVENIAVGYLTEHLGEIPRDRPLVLLCQGGARSAIAASVLRAHGFDDVINMTGGYADWSALGNPVEREIESAGVA